MNNFSYAKLWYNIRHTSRKHCSGGNKMIGNDCIYVNHTHQKMQSDVQSEQNSQMEIPLSVSSPALGTQWYHDAINSVMT